MKVAVIGAGYVGSVTGAALADAGHETLIVDIDTAKTDLIHAGRSPIFEPGLEELIERTVRKGTLAASASFDGIGEAEVVMIAVGTPTGPSGQADLSYVKAAAAAIGRHMSRQSFTVVVNKSTVPVGTADAVAAIIEAASGLRENEHFAVASNPEFLREGYALEDVYFPDRIVVGASNPAAKAALRELYRPLLERTGTRLPGEYFETDAKSAELIKYASNAFLSVKISYVNEIARLCEALGANALDVAKGMGLDSRIGAKFLQISSGWSGSCFPKDTAELLATSRKYGSELSLVSAAIQSNEAMHDFCLDKLRRKLKSMNGKRIGILGLTFKPNTDDARQTQASYIVARLIELGADVAVHDPKGAESFKRLNGHLPVRYCSRGEEVAGRADAVVLLTHWDEYHLLNWEEMAGTMRRPYVLDTRNVLNRERLFACGMEYEGLGV
ncbi:UDP-glucose dehydrogenase family protein [Paenibacillus hodogayensis]|uniref:UDP-glucose 6-dehydrogenase n=1 Tax=Paenibacillus hodogayensis TaxID=279208 RepID=A0ABV5VTE5_9BACL